MGTSDNLFDLIFFTAFFLSMEFVDRMRAVVPGAKTLMRLSRYYD